MSWVNMTVPAVGDPTKKTAFAETAIGNLAFLYNLMLSLTGAREVIINGSFESDVDSDNVPDGWTASPFAGGTVAREESTVLADGKARHGKWSVKFTAAAGTGGGTLELTDPFECTPGRNLEFTWQMKGTADVRNKVDVIFYDPTGTLISTVNIYDEATANPTAWTLLNGIAAVPGTAAFCKLKFTGADSSDPTNGSVWIDDVKVNARPVPVQSRYERNVPGTYKFVVPNGVTLIEVTVLGGGGGGGGGQAAGSNGGGGGGGGGAARSFLSVTPGGTHTFTIGAGGTGGGTNNAGTAGAASTWVFGAVTLTGNGGGGGLEGSANGVGGAGGGATGGSFNTTGDAGGTTNLDPAGGQGGVSRVRGAYAAPPAASAGGDGPDYGAGGAGGAGSGGVGYAGGAGAAGAVIVRW
jgi:hypothetical protein